MFARGNYEGFTWRGGDGSTGNRVEKFVSFGFTVEGLVQEGRVVCGSGEEERI